jgi:hypothetical protein
MEPTPNIFCFAHFFASPFCVMDRPGGPGIVKKNELNVQTEYYFIICVAKPYEKLSTRDGTSDFTF